MTKKSEVKILDFPENRKLSPGTANGIRLINLDIIQNLVNMKGKMPLALLESKIGLQSINPTMINSLLIVMRSNKLVFMEHGIVYAMDIKKLMLVIEQEKTVLPENHNKLWSEAHIITTCEMKIAKRSNREIAKTLKRTQNSVCLQWTHLKKGYMLIPVIKNNKVVLEALEMAIKDTPNPA